MHSILNLCTCVGFGYYCPKGLFSHPALRTLIDQNDIHVGYGYYRPKVYSFDPGWKGEQAKGPEDAGIADLGNDPLGIIERHTTSSLKNPCT